MHFFNLYATAAALLSVTAAKPVEKRQNKFAGYLVSTFADSNPTVQWYLSNGNSPTNFTKINRGNPVLTSTVGTKAVRDVYLTSTSARNQWFIIATDLDINAPGFSWDEVTRRGSRGIVVWQSNNLVDWSSASLKMCVTLLYTSFDANGS